MDEIPPNPTAPLWPVTLTVCLGLSISGLIAFQLRSAEWSAIRENFENAASNRIAGIQREIDAHLDQIHLLASLEADAKTLPKKFRWAPALAASSPCPYQFTVSSAAHHPSASERKINLHHPVCRDGQLHGHLVWSFSVDQLVESGIRSLRPYGVDITVYDSSAPPEQRLLYYHPSRRHRVRPTQARDTPLRFSRSFPVGERVWYVQCDGVPDFLDAAFSWAPFGFLCSGFLITAIGALLLHQRLNRMAAVEILVLRRTRELVAAHQVAADASRLKSEFLANVSHELRTPLNGILGMSALLVESNLSPSDRETSSIILRSARHLLGLVNDLLDTARIEAGKIEIRSAPFALDELIADVLAAARPAAVEKGLNLYSVIAPATPSHWHGDSLRLHQVLLNLVGNAIKFTESGKVRIEASAAAAVLTLAVVDQGIGIEPAQQDRIFRRFAQADGGPRRRHGGLGLGLAICRELLSLMGGVLNLKSVPGQGSTFTASLPLSIAAAPNASTTPSFAIPFAPGTPILLAEDNPINRIVAVRILERLGYLVHAVPDGQAAVSAAATGRFSAVLMDCQMPILDGFAATRAIRALPGAPSRIPIIALTANAMEDDRRLCLAAGMNSFLSKPIDVGQLDQALRRWLLPLPLSPSPPANPAPFARR